MPEFLKLLPPDQALRIFLDAVPIRVALDEWLDTSQSAGRVTAESIYAPESLPAFTRSTVDGYAVIARETFGASESLPAYLKIIGEISMGVEPDFKVHPGEAAIIHTGGMLPENADAVVMLEHSQISDRDQIEVLRPAAPGENLLLYGEDVKIGEEILSAGIKLKPSDLGGLLALGLLKVKTIIPPLVGIISSGDEIVPPSVVLKPGQIRDINSYTLAAFIRQNGGEPIQYGIVPDGVDDLMQVLSNALKESDIVIITAGSSASARDFTAEVINQMGEPGVLVHGVNIRPGKPTILAVCGQTPVIGLPGNPVSALVIAQRFISPLINLFLKINKKPWYPTISAALSTNLPSQAGREDWFPVHLNLVGERLIAVPIFFKSNFIFNLSRADGLICIPPDANGLASGTLVDVHLFLI
jgi:molybdopterin molybdotransferase